jgi:hypothetical protein
MELRRNNTPSLVFILLSAAIPAVLGFAKGPGGHSSGSHSSSHSASRPSERTVHVESHVTKNGEFVKAYDRAPPHTLASPSANLGANAVERVAAESKSPTKLSPTVSAHFHASTGEHTASFAEGVARDSRGRIERSSDARREFERMTGYPNGRPGYVIDHIVALKRGGPDTPANMQWQTKEEAKAKDRWE